MFTRIEKESERRITGSFFFDHLFPRSQLQAGSVILEIPYTPRYALWPEIPPGFFVFGVRYSGDQNTKKIKRNEYLLIAFAGKV